MNGLPDPSLPTVAAAVMFAWVTFGWTRHYKGLRCLVFAPARGLVAGAFWFGALSAASAIAHATNASPEAAGSRECAPGYGRCLRDDGTDYDCAGGPGNGPRTVYAPIRVRGSDPFDLDRDGDGTGCDEPRLHL